MSKIIVGVGGGIAAYKMAIVVSRLVQANHDVRVVMTKGAMHFVGEATFAALCSQPPISDTYDSTFPLGAHIELAEDADLMVVAPTTARLAASFAHGLADDLLATLYLSRECPVLLAPAMSNTMWEKPAVQRNIEQLKADGVYLVGPDSGWLSCRRKGVGRMAEPEALLAEIENLLSTEA